MTYVYTCIVVLNVYVNAIIWWMFCWIGYFGRYVIIVSKNRLIKLGLSNIHEMELENKVYLFCLVDWFWVCIMVDLGYAFTQITCLIV